MPGPTVWGTTWPLSGPFGQLTIPFGNFVHVVNDTRVTPYSIILAQLQNTDATVTGIRAIAPGSGIFTITLDATLAANMVVGYVIINPSNNAA